MSIDHVIVEFDRALRTVFASARSQRPSPALGLVEAVMNEGEKTHACGLMRVNHCGEICAQALYQGQALTSFDPAVRDALRGAANEETEHLAWTEQRIAELGVLDSWQKQSVRSRRTSMVILLFCLSRMSAPGKLLIKCARMKFSMPKQPFI